MTIQTIASSSCKSYLPPTAIQRQPSRFWASFTTPTRSAERTRPIKFAQHILSQQEAGQLYMPNTTFSTLPFWIPSTFTRPTNQLAHLPTKLCTTRCFHIRIIQSSFRAMSSITFLTMRLLSILVPTLRILTKRFSKSTSFAPLYSWHRTSSINQPTTTWGSA